MVAEGLQGNAIEYRTDCLESDTKLKFKCKERDKKKSRNVREKCGKTREFR